MRNKQSQKGYGLVLLMVILAGLGSAVTIMSIQTERQAEIREYRSLGNKLSEHSRAVGEWVIDNTGTAIPATYTGTDWLKSNTDCGITTGGAIPYLPCDFSFTTGRFGDTPTTVVTNSGGVTTVVTTWPALTEAGEAKIVGSAHSVNQAIEIGGDELSGLVTYTDDNNAVITATVDITNGASVYVRRNGDSMSGNLDMTGNNLNNVGVITASQGSFSTSSLGTATATSLNSNTLSATTGTITDLNSTDLTATNGTIPTLNSTNITTTDLIVSGAANITNLDGNLAIQSVKTAGNTCTGVGRLARTLSGELLTCKGGTWQGQQVSRSIDYGSCYDVQWSNAVYYNSCPVDYAFVGAAKNGSDSGEWIRFRCCKII
ncbi:hypothetical protein [uncultured Amphritea sp.]|uniref:hypothetical protein n=1 Tax=uncultured Amphritea sp. TaxID=981605 RepID=UPI002604D013|nr:hypothetical protein [uncultured Amphritea sp.]